MSTLKSAACAAVVDRLFVEAAASDAKLRERKSALEPNAQNSLPMGTDDYHALYRELRDFHLAVSRKTATLLYMLARSSAAKTIVEFGTSFGLSTVYLGAALRDNGGGRLIGTEFEPTKVSQACANIGAAGLDDLVEIRAGDAIDTLSRDLPEVIDLVLLDGAKGLYPRVLSMLESRLGAGALVVADNADWSPQYLARVRDPGGGYLSLPIEGDLELSMRLGGSQ